MSVDAVLIAGPTACGKSAAAIALAERLRGVIINADSMQVYSELRTLTARPSEKDEARVPHHLYGHVSMHERYSAGRYQDEAISALADIRAQNLLPVFVGGTGLYFAALTEGLSPIPSVPQDIRNAVRQRFEDLGRDAFFADLAQRDPTMAAKLRPSDTQRLLRAADVLEATGRSLSEWQGLSGAPALAGLRLARFVVAPKRETLAARINDRFDAMIKSDALTEARNVRGLDPSLPAARALGLPQIWRHLDGELDLQTAMDQAKLATRQYAKRQLTWFRNRMGDWNWLEADEISNLVAVLSKELS